jgi:hypothetical protein
MKKNSLVDGVYSKLDSTKMEERPPEEKFGSEINKVNLLWN